MNDARRLGGEARLTQIESTIGKEVGEARRSDPTQPLRHGGRSSQIDGDPVGEQIAAQTMVDVLQTLQGG